MRKIKKINGFLVVKFNDREKREYEGTALGEYGVIDAEVYTGNLDIDRGAMEYDDADTLEVAVELARGLESEEDITDEPPTYTAAVETNESYTEEAVEPARQALELLLFYPRPGRLSEELVLVAFEGKGAALLPWLPAPVRAELAQRYRRRTPPGQMLPNQKKLWKALSGR